VDVRCYHGVGFVLLDDAAIDKRELMNYANGAVFVLLAAGAVYIWALMIHGMFASRRGSGDDLIRETSRLSGVYLQMWFATIVSILLVWMMLGMGVKP
jgi:hypothetical protein